MRTLFFILFFVLGFCHIQARGQKPAHVIITAGQSNTDGRVPVSYTHLTLPTKLEV